MRTIYDTTYQELFDLYFQRNDEWKKYVTQKEMDELLMRGVDRRLIDVRESPWFNAFSNYIYDELNPKSIKTLNEFKKIVAEYYSTEKVDEECERLALWNEFQKEHREIAAYEKKFDIVSDFHAMLSDEAYEAAQQKLVFGLVSSAIVSGSIINQVVCDFVMNAHALVQKERNRRKHKEAEEKKCQSKLQLWKILEQFVLSVFKPFLDATEEQEKEIDRFLFHLKDANCIRKKSLRDFLPIEIPGKPAYHALNTFVLLLKHIKKELYLIDPVFSTWMLYKLFLDIQIDKVVYFFYQKDTLCHIEEDEKKYFFRNSTNGVHITLSKINVLFNQVMTNELFAFVMTKEIQDFFGAMTNTYRIIFCLQDFFGPENEKSKVVNPFLQNIMRSIRVCLNYLYKHYLSHKHFLIENKAFHSEVFGLWNEMEALATCLKKMPDHSDILCENFLDGLNTVLGHIKESVASFKVSLVSPSNLFLMPKKTTAPSSVALKKH